MSSCISTQEMTNDIKPNTGCQTVLRSTELRCVGLYLPCCTCQLVKRVTMVIILDGNLALIDSRGNLACLSLRHLCRSTAVANLTSFPKYIYMFPFLRSQHGLSYHLV